MNSCRRMCCTPAVMAFVVHGGVVHAEQHIQEVLQHTGAAVHAVGDSQSIGRHVSDALELIDEAREANASRPDVLEYIGRGEEELGSAVRHARRFNSSTAWQDAVDAERYLEAADQAANGQPPR